LKIFSPVVDYQLRSKKITPNTSRSSPNSEESRGSTTTMNNQFEGVRNVRDHIDDDENPHQNGAANERFVPRMLLYYTAPQATNGRGLIRLPHLTSEPPPLQLWREHHQYYPE
jgi:hypothetical protein